MTRWQWGALVWVLAVLTALLALASCGARPVTAALPALPAPPATPPPIVRPGSSSADAGTVAEWEGEVARLRSQLAAAEGERDAARGREAEEQRSRLRAVCYWAAGLCLLGAIACAVLAWFLPLGRRRLALAAAGCAAGAALAVGLASALPYLALAGVVAVGFAGLGATVWVIRELRTGALDVASEWRRYASGLAPEIRVELDRGSKDRQLRPEAVGRILSALPGLPHPDRRARVSPPE